MARIITREGKIIEKGESLGEFRARKQKERIKRRGLAPSEKKALKRAGVTKKEFVSTLGEIAATGQPLTKKQKISKIEKKTGIRRQPKGTRVVTKSSGEKVYQRIIKVNGATKIEETPVSIRKQTKRVVTIPGKVKSVEREKIITGVTTGGKTLEQVLTTRKTVGDVQVATTPTGKPVIFEKGRFVPITPEESARLSRAAEVKPKTIEVKAIKELETQARKLGFKGGKLADEIVRLKLNKQFDKSKSDEFKKLIQETKTKQDIAKKKIEVIKQTTKLRNEKQKRNIDKFLRETFKVRPDIKDTKTKKFLREVFFEGTNMAVRYDPITNPVGAGFNVGSLLEQYRTAKDSGLVSTTDITLKGLKKVQKGLVGLGKAQQKFLGLKPGDVKISDIKKGYKNSIETLKTITPIVKDYASTPEGAATIAVSALFIGIPQKIIKKGFKVSERGGERVIELTPSFIKSFKKASKGVLSSKSTRVNIQSVKGVKTDISQVIKNVNEIKSNQLRVFGISNKSLSEIRRLPSNQKKALLNLNNAIKRLSDTEKKKLSKFVLRGEDISLIDKLDKLRFVNVRQTGGVLKLRGQQTDSTMIIQNLITKVSRAKNPREQGTIFLKGKGFSNTEIDNILGQGGLGVTKGVKVEAKLVKGKVKLVSRKELPELPLLEPSQLKAFFKPIEKVKVEKLLPKKIKKEVFELNFIKYSAIVPSEIITKSKKVKFLRAKPRVKVVPVKKEILKVINSKEIFPSGKVSEIIDLVPTKRPKLSKPVKTSLKDIGLTDIVAKRKSKRRFKQVPDPLVNWGVGANTPLTIMAKPDTNIDKAGKLVNKVISKKKPNVKVLNINKIKQLSKLDGNVPVALGGKVKGGIILITSEEEILIPKTLPSQPRLIQPTKVISQVKTVRVSKIKPRVKISQLPNIKIKFKSKTKPLIKVKPKSKVKVKPKVGVKELQIIKPKIEVIKKPIQKFKRVVRVVKPIKPTKDKIKILPFKFPKSKKKKVKISQPKKKLEKFFWTPTLAGDVRLRKKKKEDELKVFTGLEVRI